MRGLVRILLVLSVMALAVLVLFFVLENQQAVSLVLLGWPLPAVPVALPILVAMLAGLAVGPLLASYYVVRNNRRRRPE